MGLIKNKIFNFYFIYPSIADIHDVIIDMFPIHVLVQFKHAQSVCISHPSFLIFEYYIWIL